MSPKERRSSLRSLSRFAIRRSSRSPRGRRFQSPALLAPSETSLVIHSDQDLMRENNQQSSRSPPKKKLPKRMKPRHKAIVCRDPLYQQRVRIILGLEVEAELGEQEKSLCWRYKKFRAEIGKPSIDPRFAHLPGPYANKVICRDPIKDKIRRPFIVARKALSSSGWRRKKKEYRRFSCAMPRLDFDENIEREEPRFCPQILPHGHRVERALLDKFHDPPADDYARYYEHSKRKRNKRDHRFYVQENRRRMDNDVLKYHGRFQVNDWLIGRPPPLPKRVHTEIQLHRLNRENMPLWKQAEMLAQIPPTPVTPEVDPADIIPTANDYSFIWDRAMLNKRRKFGEHVTESIELAAITPKNGQRCNDPDDEGRRDSLASTVENSVQPSELRSGEASILDVNDRMNETPKSDNTIRESRIVVQPLSPPRFGSIARRDTLTEGEGLLEDESKTDSEDTIILDGDREAYPPMPTRPPPEVPEEIVLVRPYKMKAMQKTYRESIAGSGKLALIRTSTDSSTEIFPELRDLWTNSPVESESPGADSKYLQWQPEKPKDVRRHRRRDSSMRFPVVPNSSSMMGGVESRQRHKSVKSIERPVTSPFSSSIGACEDFNRFPSIRKPSQGGSTPGGAKERRGRFPVAVNSGAKSSRDFGASRKNSLNARQDVENGGSMKHVRRPSVFAGTTGLDLSNLSIDDFDFRSPQLPPPIPPRSPMRMAALRPLILGHASQSRLNGAVVNANKGRADVSMLELSSKNESERCGGDAVDVDAGVDTTEAERCPIPNRPPTPMFGLGIEFGRKRGRVAPAAEPRSEQVPTVRGRQAAVDQSLVTAVLDNTTPKKSIPPVPQVAVQKELGSTPKTPVKTPGKLTVVWPPVNTPGARATSPSSFSPSTLKNLAINVIPATPEINIENPSPSAGLASPSPASRGRVVSLARQILDTYEDSAEKVRNAQDAIAIDQVTDSAKIQIEKESELRPNSCANSHFLGEQKEAKVAHRTTSKAKKLPWILRAEQQKAAEKARQAAFEKEQHEYIAEMESKLLRPVEVNSVKAKAEQDAKQMHQAVMAECAKTGKPPPPYGLTELIGKGTFGRVYKAKDFNTAGIVAVKIIDIDESDTLNPRNADALSDFMKEVNALKKLSESKARNINHVIEALPVGKAMWMITDYCGGGSVATLMKPTAPGGLVEKYIITIVREVAEAVGWVHAADIIHRDIKCANVLVTEQGGVQLCDFGVAGMIENKIDKRSTIIGTPHWMAPELFDAQPNYGKEVDIWAFGSLVYEVATGWPPNVSNGIPYQQLGSHLRQHTPRLEGGDYSDGLRDLVAYCLEELPSARPTIQQVQQHAYIANTSGRYPTSSLSQLVKAFREWEERGGSRKSLFMAGGAQGPSESNTAADDEWNFGTASSFDLEVSQRRSTQDLREATEFTEETKRPKGSRRRPPPAALSRLPPPLVKVFDPNTLSSYQDNVKNRYYPDDNRPPQTSDLPFRNDSMNNEVNDRVSMIDLGGHDPTTGISHFPSMDTLKPGARRIDEETDDYNSTLHDFSRPALSDPADVNPNRRTQDWKFPSMIPPASADPEVSRFPTSYEVPRPAVTPSTGGRPALVHHPTEPLGASFGGGLLGAGQPALDRRSIAESLIDLDMSLPDTFDLQRPSTANSDVGSTTSEQMGSENPFAFDNHVSYQAPVGDSLEPSLYITEDTPPPPERSETTRDINEISDFSASEPEGPDPNDATRYDSQGFSDTDYISMPPPPRPLNASASNGLGEYSMSHFPALVDPPSKAALDGTASRAEMVGEVTRVLGSMTAQLEAFRDVYGEESGLRRGPGSRRRQ